MAAPFFLALAVHRCAILLGEEPTVFIALRPVVTVLCTFSCALAAQMLATQSGRPMPPPYSGVRTQVGGIFVTPVPNAPFFATVEIVSHQAMPDGTEHVVTTTNHIARASSGRIYNERRVLVPATFKGEPRLLSAHIYDPSSRLSTFYTPQTHVARQMTLRAPDRTPQAALPPAQQVVKPGVTETDLGSQQLDGVELHGRRDTRVVSAEASGTGKPVTVTDEYWYSEALSIYMIIRHNDPRTGEQLVAVSKVERVEPDAQRFAVPSDYKIVDETPPESPSYPQYE